MPVKIKRTALLYLQPQLAVKMPEVARKIGTWFLLLQIVNLLLYTLIYLRVSKIKSQYYRNSSTHLAMYYFCTFWLFSSSLSLMVYLVWWEQSPAKTSVDSSQEVLHLTAEAPISCIHPYQSNYGLWTFVSSFAQSSKHFLVRMWKQKKFITTVIIFIPNVAKLRNW